MEHIGTYGYMRKLTKQERQLPNVGIQLCLNAYPEWVKSKIRMQSSQLQLLRPLLSEGSGYGKKHNFQKGIFLLEGPFDLVYPIDLRFDTFMEGVVNRTIDLDDDLKFPVLVQHMKQNYWLPKDKKRRNCLGLL